MLQNVAVTPVFWEELPDLHCLVNFEIQDDNKKQEKIQVYCKTINLPEQQKSIEIKPCWIFYCATTY